MNRNICSHVFYSMSYKALKRKQYTISLILSNCGKYFEEDREICQSFRKTNGTFQLSVWKFLLGVESCDRLF